MLKHIVICDDHSLFLNGIAELLKKVNPNYSILKFNQVNACKDYLMDNVPDVFICDLNINNEDGFSLLEALRSPLKNTKKIILTAYYEDFLIQKAKKMGVNAFLKKETTAEELVNVIEADSNTEFYVNGSSGNKNVSVYIVKIALL